MKTVEEIEKTIKRKLENDDFERANCPKSGEIGHWQCGWCSEHDQPRFQCGCLLKKQITIDLFIRS